MRLALVAIALVVSFGFVAPAAAEAPPPKQRVVMHYPTLEKMLRRFAAQAGTTSTGKVFASR